MGKLDKLLFYLKHPLIPKLLEIYQVLRPIKSYWTTLILVLPFIFLQITGIGKSHIIEKYAPSSIDALPLFEKLLWILIELFFANGSWLGFVTGIVIFILISFIWYKQITAKQSVERKFIDSKIAFVKWSRQTDVNLVPELVLASRDEEKGQLLGMLESRPSKIIISSRSEQESYAFAICALKENILYAEKTFVVRRQEDWDYLIDNAEAQVLILQSFVPDSIGLAIDKGKHIVEPIEGMNGALGQNIIVLPNIKKSKKVSIIESMGFSHDKAWEIYSDTKGYLHAIIRHPFLKPIESTKPEWIEKYGISTLSTILFINSWDRNNENDKKIIERLSGEQYGAFEEKLYVLKTEKETPIRLIGNIWQVISKIYLWDQIAAKIPEPRAQKLEQIVIDVFTEVDPSFFVAPKDRLYALDKKMSYSGLLRGSLADTLALISVFWADKNYAKQWLGRLFQTNINADAWYSYNRQLMLLAEACPSCFLDTIETAIDKINETHIELLFDSGDDIFGGCYHCNLLWALETISWNKDYVVRVVLVLARLCDIEIKSKMANQPLNTLAEIFLGWVNYSGLTHAEKIQILELLTEKYKNIAWQLILKLLPSMHSFATTIAKPKYHDWDESLPKEVYNADYRDYIAEINRLFLVFVKDEKSPWYEIFDNIDKLNLKTAEKVIDIFMSLNKNNFDEDTRLSLAEKLRNEIYKHRKHPSADWAIQSGLVDKLEQAFYFIEPERLIYKYKFLFENGWGVHTLNPTPYQPEEKNDYDLEAKESEQLRNDAIKEMLAAKNLSEIISLAKSVQMPGLIGVSLAKVGFADIDVLLEWLKDSNLNMVVCARCYFDEALRANAVSFEDILSKNPNDQQLGEIFKTMSFCKATFELLQRQNEKTQRYYWINLNHYYGLPKEDYDWINWILEQFMKFKYPMKAIGFFAQFLHGSKANNISVDTKIIFELLMQFLTNENQEQLNYHGTSEAIRFLQDSHNNGDEIQHIEWLYIGLDGIRPKAIERELVKNPKMFVELVSWVYKPKHSDAEDEGLTQEQISNRAEGARRVLKKMSFIFIQPSELINDETMKSWIVEARKLFKEADRIEIGDIKIGEMLSRSPIGADGIWPHEAVREILEEFASKDLIDGFSIGKQNLRGVTTRLYDDGGEQEYELAKHYAHDAEAIKLSHPNTSRILQELSEIYSRDGKWEDERNEIEC